MGVVPALSFLIEPTEFDQAIDLLGDDRASLTICAPGFSRITVSLITTRERFDWLADRWTNSA
jgi:hypothetical protein